jgi:hypothetical protein
VSPFPGPIVIGGHSYPIGEDWFVVLSGVFPTVGFLSANVLIPNAPEGVPEIGTITFYAIVAAASPDQRIISVSEQFSLAIDF